MLRNKPVSAYFHECSSLFSLVWLPRNSAIKASAVLPNSLSLVQGGSPFLVLIRVQKPTDTSAGSRMC